MFEITLHLAKREMQEREVLHQWQSLGVSAAAHIAGNVQLLQLVMPGHGYFVDWQVAFML